MATESVAQSRWIPWVAAATEADWDGLYREQLPRVYNFFRYRLGEGPEAVVDPRQLLPVEAVPVGLGGGGHPRDPSALSHALGRHGR